MFHLGILPLWVVLNQLILSNQLHYNLLKYIFLVISFHFLIFIEV